MQLKTVIVLNRQNNGFDSTLPLSFTFFLMKHLATRLAGGLLLAAAPWLTAAAQTTTIDYRGTTGTTTVEKRRATETNLATSVTFGAYNTGVANSQEATTSNGNDIFQLTGQYNAQIDGRALVWRQDNTGTALASGVPSTTVNTATPFKAQVLLTFSREVTGLTFVIQDIDKGTLATGGGSDYTDELDFYPVNGAGNAVDMSSGISGNIGNLNTCGYYGPSTIDGKTQVALYGRDLNGTTSAPSRGGNVTIRFAQPIKTMLLTYRNLNTYTQSALRLQTIAFEQISWDEQADLTANVVNSTVGQLVAGKTGQFTATFGNMGDLDTDNVTAQVKLTPIVSGVTASNGGVYDSQTGIITYPTSAMALYKGQLTSVITYTAPAAKTVVTAVATVTTTTSEGLNPYANSASASATPVAPLPVSLTAFAAKASGPDVRLSWATASELNNDYFEVERSTDGATFAPLGRLAGHGTTLAANSYAYLDAGVASRRPGRAYYRLRQVDLDGTATYSPVRTVDLAGADLTAAVGLYPNPAAPTDAAVTLDLRSLPQGAYEVSLVSTLGSTVARYTAQGGQDQPLSLPKALASGPYVVLVQGNGLHLTQRLARR
jgi:hypothetical protein